MKIRTLIASSASVVIAIIMIASALTGVLIYNIKIGGPLQLRQQEISDYVADILPPPEYIIEPYLEASLALTRPDTVAAHAARLAVLHNEYEVRHTYWTKANIDPALRDRLTVAAHEHAQTFWTELETQFLPALRAGRIADANASYARLTAAYARHRTEIDAAVAQGTEVQSAIKAESARYVTRAEMAAGAAGVVVLLALLGFFWLINRRAIAPLGAAALDMQRLSSGDYSPKLGMPDRQDEIGALIRGLEEFRLAAIAKQEADAERARAEATQKMVVETVSAHLADLSDGDLTAKINEDFPGSYETLKTNFNDALAKLRDLIGSVRESARTISTGSGEIAQASEDLARRTESNAANLEQTAASVTQMDARLKATASSAALTVERADQAIATVGTGRSVADEAMQAMGRVSDSAKGIDSVIEGLDKIAFQTRVLAMNAAVEAGRAGEAGRGFAVVADLVSALAMRAEEEAGRARDQLTVTQTDIGTAVEAVTKVDTALADISGDVAQVHELLATMASDNQAQSTAITEISTAIGMMDRATQQNAAMVEETSAAARSLASEVGGLAERANRFKVGAGTAPAKQSRDFSAMLHTPSARHQPVAATAAPAPAGDDWTAF